MKKLFYIILFLVVALPLAAKKDSGARKVLDGMAARLEKAGGIRAQFVVSSYTGTSKEGTQTGVFLTDGHRFQMQTHALTTWFDGKTQWSYYAQTDEVNVSTPTSAELQVMNPFAFVGIYKKGFNYTLSSATYKGKSVHEVRLVAQKKSQDIKRIILTVDKTSMLPLCVRVLQGKAQWVRIAVSSFLGGQKFGTETFRFDKKKYPKAEVIDLR